jgi:SAM-dependent methyltransferase
MLILNLGCGIKVSANPDVINVDWSMYFRLKNPFFYKLAPLILDSERLLRFNALPNNVMPYNLAKGIPFASNSVDVVYHSHLLEHLDRNVAQIFLSEIKRVLKIGGILRIVVPDLHILCQTYLDHIAEAEADPREADRHDEYVARIIEQSVRKEAFGTSQQSPLRRWIENKFLGDARHRGETHQWMYDKINLSNMLFKTGYRNIQQRTYETSEIPGWHNYGLDLDEYGNEYKPSSLYLEAVR